MTTTAARRDALRRYGVQPGAFSCAEAAAYVGLCPNTFLAEVAAGKMPPPLALASRRKLWSRAALDRVLGADHSSQERLQEEMDKAIADAPV